MPSIRTIPARTAKFCEPCVYHKLLAAQYGQPGTTWRMYSCLHHDAHGPMPEGLTPEQAAKWGEIRGRIAEHGRSIGKTDERPAWCPLKSDEEVWIAEILKTPDTTCDNCGLAFNYDRWVRVCPKGYIGTPEIVPNTLTNLTDHNSPRVKCPRCLVWMDTEGGIL